MNISGILGGISCLVGLKYSSAYNDEEFGWWKLETLLFVAVSLL